VRVLAAPLPENIVEVCDRQGCKELPSIAAQIKKRRAEGWRLAHVDGGAFIGKIVYFECSLALIYRSQSADRQDRVAVRAFAPADAQQWLARYTAFPTL
jgi:hypothetical protein